MGWEIIKNSEPDFKDEKYVGECPRYHKTATVTVAYSGRQMRKTDLQKTYHEYGRKCNLLTEIDGITGASCMATCPLVSM